MNITVTLTNFLIGIQHGLYLCFEWLGKNM